MKKRHNGESKSRKHENAMEAIFTPALQPATSPTHRTSSISATVYLQRTIGRSVFIPAGFAWLCTWILVEFSYAFSTPVSDPAPAVWGTLSRVSTSVFPSRYLVRMVVPWCLVRFCFMLRFFCLQQPSFSAPTNVVWRLGVFMALAGWLCLFVYALLVYLCWDRRERVRDRGVKRLP